MKQLRCCAMIADMSGLILRQWSELGPIPLGNGRVESCHQQGRLGANDKDWLTVNV